MGRTKSVWGLGEGTLSQIPEETGTLTWTRNVALSFRNIQGRIQGAPEGHRSRLEIRRTMLLPNRYFQPSLFQEAINVNVNRSTPYFLKPLRNHFSIVSKIVNEKRVIILLFLPLLGVKFSNGAFSFNFPLSLHVLTCSLVLKKDYQCSCTAGVLKTLCQDTFN